MKFLGTLVRFGVLATLGWVAGVIAYLVALRIVYGQSISRGDFVGVLVWSATVLGPCILLVHLPALFSTRRLLKGNRPAWVFSIVAALVGIVPTFLVLARWGGGVRSLWSPEAGLFLCLFAVTGLVIGAGFAWAGRGTRTSAEPDR